ncbi:MAG: hypothetical protein U0457_18455 [Candidatus Sericytochromatia bacterium]
MMDINNAYRVAAYYDFNRDGQINTGWFHKEIEFDRNAKRVTDTNRDGNVSIHEFAQALSRGDVMIGYDQKVYSTNPFDGPGGHHPGGYPYPGGGSPYYPGGAQPYPQPYPGGWSGGNYGNIVGGAAVGGAIGYIAGGGKGAGEGAVIGGFIGALSNLFRN